MTDDEKEKLRKSAMLKIASLPPERRKRLLKALADKMGIALPIPPEERTAAAKKASEKKSKG